MAAIHGVIRLRPEIFPPLPGDLAGSVYVGVLTDLTGAPAALGVFVADFSVGPVDYRIEDISPGRYMVAAMLDDNDSFSPSSPRPDAGDVWNPLGADIEVGPGDDLEIDLMLDTPVPGDEPVCGAEPLDAAGRRCVFDFLWTLADRYYPFFALKSVDWDAVRAAYEPRLDEPATEGEFRLLMARLLAELRDGHSGVALATLAADLGRTATVAGVALVPVGTDVYVTSVEPGSAAETAGLQVGDHVLSIDGGTFAEHVASVGPYLPRPNDPFHQAWLLRLWLAGAVASNAVIEIERGPATLMVARAPLVAPALAVTSARLSGTSGSTYGYIRIPTFDGDRYDLLGQFAAALASFPDVDGLILDVRDNSGGAATYANAMIAQLVAAPTVVEHDYLRGSADEYVPARVDPAAATYTGPLVVLTDELSYSCAHLFPAALRHAGRATTVGRATGGGNGTPETWTVTSALDANVSTAFALVPSGTPADELGTAPDVAVALTVDDIRAGLYSERGTPATDVALQRAIEQLGD